MGRYVWIGVIITALLIMMSGGVSYAFHSGGVAECEGCHSMHNSSSNPIRGPHFLKGTDSSSTCLNCHAHGGNAIGQNWGYHVVSDDGGIMSAGGDFYWVSHTYTSLVNGETVTGGGDNAGHNVVAIDYGLTADTNPNNQQAPGGTYPANRLGCTSCHDAHGQFHGGTAHGHGAISVSGSYGAADPTNGTIHGNYRLLGDDQYTTGDGGVGEIQFTASAPIATADSASGKSVAYGENMSEWCSNCHDAFLVDTSDAHKHLSGNDIKLEELADIYGSYIKTGDATGTDIYEALVPIELGEKDGSRLNPTDPFDGGAYAASDGNVTCLTCHRAHASAFDNMTRWDMETAFLAESKALHAIDLTAAQMAIVYYKNGAGVDIPTEYGAYQRSLCNKCHIKD